MINFFKKILKSESSDSLSKKTAKGSFWLFIFRVFDQVFRFVRIIILARILSPSDFGLFGIALMAMSFLDTFFQSGFYQALVHKKDDIKKYLDTSFIVQVLRGLILALILFFSAPYISSFFSVGGAESILKFIALAIFIQGLTNVAVIYLSKELEFHKYFIYQISGTLADFFVSITLAIILRNVWALIFGFLAGAILRSIVSYVVYFYRPRLNFSFSMARELFDYGKWVFGSNIVGFFTSQIDSFFVAKLLGVASLGFYQVAYKVPSILGIEVLAGATFPAYSKIQDDKVRLKGAYLRIMKLFAFILMPIAGGIFVMASDFVVIFLGVNWIPSIWPIRVLSLATLIWTMAVISDYLFLAVGRPNIQVKWTSIKLCIMIVLLYPFIMSYNIIGSSIVILLGSLVASFGLVFEALKIIGCNIRKLLFEIMSPFVSALIMSIFVYFLKEFLPSELINFIIIIITGVLLYIALIVMLDKVFHNNIVGFLKENFYLLIK